MESHSNFSSVIPGKPSQKAIIQVLVPLCLIYTMTTDDLSDTSIPWEILSTACDSRPRHLQKSSKVVWDDQVFRLLWKRETNLSRSCRRAVMKKWKAWAFSSTRKDMRPKKWTTPPMAWSMLCHAVGGWGGPSSPPCGAYGPPAINISINESIVVYILLVIYITFNQFVSG